MRRDLSAVTIRATGRRVDVTLPNVVPLIEITPMVAALCHADGDDARPPAWTLARVGQPPLALTTTLTDAGVLDGETLHLVDVSAWDSPHVVTFDDPVAGAVTAGNEQPSSAVVGLALLASVVVLLATGAGVVAAVPALRLSAGPALLAAAAAALVVAFLLPARADRRPSKVALVCGAWAMAAAAGWSLVGGQPGRGLTGAGVALLVAVLAAAPLAGEMVPGFALFAVALTAGSAAVAAGAHPVQSAAVAAVAATIGVRVGPRLLGAWLSRRVAARPGDVEALSRGSRILLVSGTYGCVGVAVAAGVILAATGDRFGLVLAAVTGGSLALRAATFRYAREALPAAVGAGVIMFAAVVAAARVATAHGWGGAAVLVLSALGIGLAVITAVQRGTAGSPRRAATWWALVDACTAPLTLGALGVFHALVGLIGGIFN
jgi:hypothetical protein